VECVCAASFLLFCLANLDVRYFARDCGKEQQKRTIADSESKPVETHRKDARPADQNEGCYSGCVKPTINFIIYARNAFSLLIPYTPVYLILEYTYIDR
jgi:hypothetical protein